MEFVKIGAGRLCARGRPGVRLIAALPGLGCTGVVTLLSEREGAPSLGEAVTAAGLAWIWLPLANGRSPEGRAREQVIAALPSLVERLQAGESLLVHCAAGLHRTGMITWALLRGLGVEDPRALLEKIRAQTLHAMQPHHFAFGDELYGSTAPSVQVEPRGLPR